MVLYTFIVLIIGSFIGTIVSAFKKHNFAIRYIEDGTLHVFDDGDDGPRIFLSLSDEALESLKNKDIVVFGVKRSSRK